jgi:hypothetical protein
MLVQPRQIDSQTLYSWKEIAVFLKCGVRTAQRWERNENLPTHRHSHIRRGTVYAFKDEIQEWMKSREGSQTLPSAPSTMSDSVSVPPLQLDRLYRVCVNARARAERVRGVFQIITHVPSS